ncbi:hypothetical protein BHM03_00053672, partial [Ensete ventricosum]
KERIRPQPTPPSNRSPHANGLAKVTNRNILEGLRRRVAGAPTTWVEELPSVLWALQTTSKTPTGESPYSLAFGTEIVLPPEVIFPTLRIENFTTEASEAGLRENLDMLEERRAKAHLKNLHYHRAVARLYNQRIRPRPIGTGDLVLMRAEVIEVHLDISIFETFRKGVPFDRYLGVLPPKLLERHPVPELIADPLHLLEAKLEPSGCFVGGHHLRTLGFQFGLKEHCRLDQREDIALQASSVVPSPIQTGAQEMTSCSSSLRWLLSDSNSVCIFSTSPSGSFP